MKSIKLTNAIVVALLISALLIIGMGFTLSASTAHAQINIPQVDPGGIFDNINNSRPFGYGGPTFPDVNPPRSPRAPDVIELLRSIFGRIFARG